MKRITILAVLVALILSGGCEMAAIAYLDDEPVRTYQDIPGVTGAEINAVEALKRERGSFSYGYFWETESFQMPDGSYAGFTIKICALLSELFDVAFEPVYCADWEQLSYEIDARTIDFSGAFRAAADNASAYQITKPIAGHVLKLYALADRLREFVTEDDINGLKIGFLAGSGTAASIKTLYPHITFTAVDVPHAADAVGMLAQGQLDAFVADEIMDPSFEEYEQIRAKSFFSLVYIPVSIATADPALAPVISVINKYLAADGSEMLHILYDEGNRDYIRYRLHQSYTDEEKAYLENLTARDVKVDIGLQHDVYPVSFYNEVDKEFQGIALDILTELSALTGIDFEPITTSTNTPLSEILAKLKTGEISMMTQLLYTDSRKNDYIWSRTPYHTTNYALLSRSDQPDLASFQVYYKRVGTLNKSAHEEMFNLWFPGHEHHLIYSNSAECFDALEKGEIDLLMLSENMLLTQTNYREKPGFKINISFGSELDSLFGYSKNEEELRSIVDKALAYIDTEAISNRWMTKAFDYSHKISRLQTTFVSIFALGALAVLIAILILFRKNKRLGQNLGERTAWLSTIYQSIPDIIFSMDTDYVYTGCNDSFARFVGKPEEEIIGKTDPEVFSGHSQMVDFFISVNQKVLETQSPMIVQETLVVPDGEERIFETIKLPLFQSGELTGLMGIARDITDHKVAEEEAREASRIKSEFLANMSHEIRTPMNAIIGMSELLLNEKLTDRQASYARDINVSSHSLLGIINDILDFSKIEAGKMELVLVDYDFHQMLDNLRSMFVFVAQKKGLAFLLETEGEIPRYLHGDDVRLRQILTNICGNAVKFTGKGHVRLKVTAAEDMLSFEIRDTGMGIKEDDLASLFTPFAQADTRKNRNITGTGLGLTISKNFAEMMNGDITVSSVYGEGTAFTVTIPKVLGDENAVRHSDEEKKKETLFAPNARMLVVDDNEVNLKVARGLLSMYQIDADTALSGREAIQMVQQKDYDIVFMDHMMPEMDGIETNKAIRALGEKYESLTIIALTANAISGSKELFLLNGLNGFLSKPIETDALVETLKQWLPSDKFEIRKAEGANGPETDAEAQPRQDAFWEALAGVKEIDMALGLRRLSGQEDMYREAAELFYQKLPDEWRKMEGFVTAGDWHNFTISVHGMKSSLSTVGAMELSEMASALEKAAKESDADTCRAQYPLLLYKLRKLHEKLTPVMAGENTTPHKETGTHGFLQESIQMALAAAEEFDLDECVEIIEKALAYHFGETINQQLEDARRALRDYDYETAMDTMNAIAESL